MGQGLSTDMHLQGAENCYINSFIFNDTYPRKLRAQGGGHPKQGANRILKNIDFCFAAFYDLRGARGLCQNVRP